jgi:hypothetical protein
MMETARTCPRVAVVRLQAAVRGLLARRHLREVRQQWEAVAAALELAATSPSSVSGPVVEGQAPQINSATGLSKLKVLVEAKATNAATAASGPAFLPRGRPPRGRLSGPPPGGARRSLSRGRRRRWLPRGARLRWNLWLSDRIAGAAAAYPACCAPVPPAAATSAGRWAAVRSQEVVLGWSGKQ